MSCKKYENIAPNLTLKFSRSRQNFDIPAAVKLTFASKVFLKLRTDETYMFNPLCLLANSHVMDTCVETVSSQTETYVRADLCCVPLRTGKIPFWNPVKPILTNQSLLQKNKSRRPESGLKDGCNKMEHEFSFGIFRPEK